MVKEKDRLKEAIQVTWSLEDNEEREIEGLKNAMEKHGIEKGLILTEDEKGTVDIGSKEVEVLPVRLWLLRKEC